MPSHHPKKNDYKARGEKICQIIKSGLKVRMCQTAFSLFLERTGSLLKFTTKQSYEKLLISSGKEPDVDKISLTSKTPLRILPPAESNHSSIQ